MTQHTALAQVEMRFRGKPKLDDAGKPVKDEQGNKVMVKTRENFTVQLPYLTLDGVADIIATGKDKAKDALLAAVNSVIFLQAKAQVDEDTAIKDTSGIDMSKLDWAAIAELSAADRGDASSAPSKELLEELAADYIAIMPAAYGLATEACRNAAAEFKAKFRNFKMRPDFLGTFQQRLTSWYEATSAEKQIKFAEAFEWLQAKAQAYIDEAEKANASEFI